MAGAGTGSGALLLTDSVELPGHKVIQPLPGSVHLLKYGTKAPADKTMKGQPSVCPANSD